MTRALVRFPSRQGMAGTPWLDGDRMIIAVDVEDKGATAFYTSSDAGRSWRFIHQIPNWQGTVTFLSPKVWAGCSNGGSGASCWSTDDGGASWKHTTSSVLDRLEQISFASATHAWGVLDCTAPAWRISAQCNPSVKSMLLETTDGGATWRPIG
ncbi:MAG: hypothetical protein M3P14_01450 [Chloroflexota bacterium]|nr:hypothetical protein [Chloroflexota bacterium]